MLHSGGTNGWWDCELGDQEDLNCTQSDGWNSEKQRGMNKHMKLRVWGKVIYHLWVLGMVLWVLL